MTTLLEPAFAKINLTLDVLGKRPDGYHDLKSIMQTISLRDDIRLEVGTGEPWTLRAFPATKRISPGKRQKLTATP